MTRPMTDVAPPEEATPPPPDDEMTAATRYLCVGAYVDPVFRNRCLREVYYQNRRFVAPSYGFDLVTVLEHCLRARNLTAWQDVSIVVALAVTAYLNWVAAAAIGVALICLRVIGAVWDLTRAFLARARTGFAVDTTKSPRRGLLFLAVWAIGSIVLIAVISRIVASVTTALAGGGHVSSRAGLLVAPVIFVLPVIFALWRQKRVEDFTAYRRPPPVRWNARKRTIAEQQTGNTTVYSDFEPFIGAGDIVSSWGFPQRLVRKTPDALAVVLDAKLPEGPREFDEPPFTADEIVGYVRDHLRDLTFEKSPETSIPDLTVEDRQGPHPRTTRRLRRHACRTTASSSAAT